MSTLARRYANAALDACVESAGGDSSLSTERIAGLAQDMRRFFDLFTQSTPLQELLHNPALKGRRDQALQDVLARLELSSAAHRLIALLARNDRLEHLEATTRDIEALADSRLGRLRAHVRAAVLPSAAQTQRIAQMLQRRLGKPVSVTTEQAPELLAGLVCQVGDLTFDSSLKRQLAVLAERLGAHAAS
jgi:F-type H+-transporting ATPase subunit delta